MWVSLSRFRAWFCGENLNFQIIWVKKYPVPNFKKAKMPKITGLALVPGG